MKYYRVQYGFGKDEFYSVDETELPKALRAQIQGAVVFLKEGTLNGERIITIKPDYQRLMGFKRDYELNGEDYSEIGRATIAAYNVFLEDVKLSIEGKKREDPKQLK